MILTNQNNRITSFVREKWNIAEDDEYVLKINDKTYIEKKLRRLEFFNKEKLFVWTLSSLASFSPFF